LEINHFRGDAFDFAALYFKLEGNELLQKLNEVLHLNIENEANIYPNKIVNYVEPILKPIKVIPPVFSYFNAPVTNTIPSQKINLVEVHRLLKGDKFSVRTNTLRKTIDPVEAKKYKAISFDYVTFSGTFSKRSDKSLLTHSSLMIIDFDHLENLIAIKQLLLNDEYFETELLFISPSGDGLKWVVSIDLTKASHQEYFLAISNYLKMTYGLEIDQSGKDVSRACFLAMDVDAFINPKYV
jgi:hypothetical protein